VTTILNFINGNGRIVIVNCGSCRAAMLSEQGALNPDLWEQANLLLKGKVIFYPGAKIVLVLVRVIVIERDVS
jgi:hypothetical protein